METTNSIFFYGCNDEFSYMSNFYKCTFYDNNGNKYNNSEQYFMKMKQETFDPENIIIAKAIMKAKTPTEVKKLGRKVDNYNEDIWNNIRYKHMLNALKLKFSQNDDIKSKLLQTYPKKLYETSATDKIWGIGYNYIQLNKLLQYDLEFKANGIVSDIIENNYFGKNLLGKALMEVRDWLEIN